MACAVLCVCLIPQAGSRAYRFKGLVRGNVHRHHEGVTHERLTGRRSRRG